MTAMLDVVISFPFVIHQSDRVKLLDILHAVACSNQNG